MKFTKFWTERHKATVFADSEKEAEAMIDATEHEVTLDVTEHESMTVECEIHRQEVSEDNPCFQCLREAAEERRYEESK